MGIVNKDTKDYVTRRREFDNSHGTLYARWLDAGTPDARYVVWSYGKHWPLYMWQKCVWFGNRTPSSRTTNNHKRVTMPAHMDDIDWRDCEDMKRLVQYGAAADVVRHLIEQSVEAA